MKDCTDNNITDEELDALILKYVRTLAPEFADVSDEDVLVWADIVKPLVSRRAFGKYYPQAVALLIAHNLKLAGYGDGTTGSVSTALGVNSYSEGEVSVSYGYGSRISANSPDSIYTLTIYGLQWLSLRHRFIIPIRNAGER